MTGGTSSKPSVAEPVAPSRRFPWVATVVVVLAVAVMVALGFWQLHRLKWKEGLLVRYAAASQMHDRVSWPQRGGDIPDVLYRRSELDCVSTSDATAVSGRSADGRAGWAHMLTCHTADGLAAPVVLGWSSDPAARAWAGGVVTGVLAPGGTPPVRLVADPPLAGLTANAAPDPRDLPNNHFSYAVQWFLFAGTALVIYAIAVWKRMTGR